jgi:hypothetical protein
MCSLDLAETHAKLVGAAARKEAEVDLSVNRGCRNLSEEGIDYYAFTAIVAVTEKWPE